MYHQEVKALGDLALTRAILKKNYIPSSGNIFRAFSYYKDISDIKVIIVGQDPYPNPEDACGLAFSVERDHKLPKSLQNIFIEIENEYGFKNTNGDLSSWAQQGVLLLNRALTVTPGEPNSHLEIWEEYTEKLLVYLAENIRNPVFMLWGKKAQSIIPLISKIPQKPNCILTSAHPSPLSAYRGFLGCGHFIQANSYLEFHGKKPIDWRT